MAEQRNLLNQKKVIIYLHATDTTQASWVVLNEQGELREAVSRGHLVDLSVEVKQWDSYVLVPAQDIFITKIAMPKLNRYQLMQALPFALEEQLIEDVSRLHFATGHPAEGQLPIAVVAKEKLDHWLAHLKQWDINPNAMFSTLFAVSEQTSGWAMLQDEDCLVRMATYQGFHCATDALLQLIELAKKENNVPSDPIPIHVTSIAETPIPLPNTESVIFNVTQMSVTAWLSNTIHSLSLSSAINLLQGDYQAKRKTSSTKKIWKVIGVVLLCWVGLMLFGNMISFFMLHRKTQEVDQAIYAIYKANFPESRSLVAPRQRMEKKLKEMEQQTNRNQFLFLLASVANEMKPGSTSSVHLLAMDFRENQLNLTISAATFDELDDLVQRLINQGLLVKQQNAVAIGSQVRATLIIQRG